MTFTQLPGTSGFFYPDHTIQYPFTIASMLIDASGEKAAAIFRVGKTCTLAKVRIYFGTVNTARDVKVSFQDVSLTTGDPDGTPDQYRVIPTASIAASTWVLTGAMTDNGADGGNKRSVTKGDLLAIVAEFDSTVGNLVISRQTLNQGLDNGTYSDLFTSSWAKTASSAGMFELQDDTGAPVPCFGLIPALGGSMNVNSGTTPDEVALYVKFPVDVKVDGAMVNIDLDGDCDVILYDSDGTTALETVSLDANVRAGTTVAMALVEFTQEHTLLANTFYRLAVKPTSVTTVVPRYMDVPVAATLDAFPGGQNAHWSQRTDAGAWTETTTRRPRFSLRVSSIHNSGGGGIIG